MLTAPSTAYYSTKVGKSNLDFNARWVHEFETKTARKAISSN